MKHISFVSFFPFFAPLEDFMLSVTAKGYEKNEVGEKKLVTPAWIVLYFSFFSFFVYPHSLLSSTAIIEESQPTRCGHTLRGVLCRGWRVAAPLRTLQRQTQ